MSKSKSIFETLAGSLVLKYVRTDQDSRTEITPDG